MPFDADECVQYDPDECRGAVETFAPGRGAALPRCQLHIDKRAEAYDRGIERYEHSDVTPGWFDPANVGEHWGSDY